MQLVEYSSSKQALGGTIQLTFVSDISRHNAEELFKSLWREVLYFEKRFSRFLLSSELSRFNTKAGVKTPVSQEFRTVLLTAKACATQTGDLYNPFILPALQRAGYKGSAMKGYENDRVPDYSERQVVESSRLEIGDNWALIPRGSAIDLGGMGKGYLADQLGNKLRSMKKISGYWLDLSGDIATYGKRADWQPISVGIQDGREISKKRTDVIIVCPSEPFGIATSGTFRRGNQSQDAVRHHIINPKTGQSAQTDVMLATVCAKSALQADVLASCGVIVGSSATSALFSKHKLLGWMVQYKTNTGKIREQVQGAFIQEQLV